MKVLDTNVLLLDAQNLLTIGRDSIICLPETVLEEMDSKKGLLSELGYQAREFGRILAKGTVTGIERTREAVLTNIDIEGVLVTVVSLWEYKANREDSGYNDQKILECAKYMSKRHKLEFVTNDVMCRLRALAMGIDAVDYREVGDDAVQFVKTLTIEDSEVFRALHGKLIQEVDTKYTLGNFNYKFCSENTNQVKLATVSREGVISVIGKDTERELRRQDIAPVNSEQLMFSKAITDESIDVVVCESLAGSGKTLVALSNAIKLVKQHKYDSILYVRASVNDVDAVEEVGFLPGLDEKFNVYLHPLHDSLDAIVRGRYKDTKGKKQEIEDKIAAGIDKVIADCNIVGQTTLGLRGRTYDKTIIIVDEIQNQSKGSLVKTMTRVGKHSKLLLLGSNNQIDNAYVTKYTNGLSVLLDACTKPQEYVNMHAVTLKKVVRGHIAEWAERLFE